MALATVDALRARGEVLGLFLGGSLTVNVGTIGSIVVNDRLAGLVLALLTLNSFVVDSVASVTGVDTSLKTGTLARVRLHELLVCAECLVHLIGADVVQEDALSERARYCSTELTVTSLE